MKAHIVYTGLDELRLQREIIVSTNIVTRLPLNDGTMDNGTFLVLVGATAYDRKLIVQLVFFR